MYETRERVVADVVGAVKDALRAHGAAEDWRHRDMTGEYAYPTDHGPAAVLAATAALPVVVRHSMARVRERAVRSMTPKQIADLCDEIEAELTTGDRHDGSHLCGL